MGGRSYVNVNRHEQSHNHHARSVLPWRRWGRPRLAVAGVWITLGLSPNVLVWPAWAQAPSVSGTASIPNSVPTEEIDWTASATPIPNTTQIELTFTIKNHDPNSTKPINFVLCAMVQTVFDAIKVPQYSIKFDVATSKWRCTLDTDTVERPPSYHFGCRRITVKPGKEGITITLKSDSLGDSVPADSKGNRFIKESDLLSTYFDILRPEVNVGPNDPEPCAKEIPSPSKNVNVHPPGGDMVPGAQFLKVSTANFWGGEGWTGGSTGPKFVHYGDGPYQRCQPHRPRPHPDRRLKTATIRFETGNWVTMNTMESYPARVAGNITGVPLDAKLRLSIGKAIAVDLPAARDGTVSIDVPFAMTPEEMDATMELTLTTRAPLEQGPVIAINADVVSRSENGFYKVGEFMYGVHGLIWHVTAAPCVDDRTRPALDPDGSLNIQATASDDTVFPSAASVLYRVGSGQERTEALSLTLLGPHQVALSGRIGPLQRDASFGYQLLVRNGAGNLAITAPHEVSPARR